VSNTPEALRLEVGATSHQGLVRTENQDRMGRVLSAFGEVIIVADGMGGHRGGATAAAMVVEGFTTHLQNLPPMTPVADAIQHAAHLTNADIHRKATDGDPDPAHMGATVVLVLVIGNQLIVGHAGDSRAYLYRAGQFTRLTRDHSFVQRMVDRNLLTEEQARDHPNANVVTRAFGQKPDIEFEVSAPMILQPGDRIMLCSDGLCGYVEDAAIEQAMSQPVSAQQITDALIELALAVGGEDNVTVQVLQCYLPINQAITAPPLIMPSPIMPPPIVPPPPSAPKKSSGLKFVLFFILVFLIATPVALHFAGVVRLWPLGAAPDSASATATSASEVDPKAGSATANTNVPTAPQGPTVPGSKPTIGFGPQPVVPRQNPVGITLPATPSVIEEEGKPFTELRVEGHKVAVILSAAIEGQPAGRFIYYRDDTVHDAANQMADRLGYPRDLVKPFSEMPGEWAKDFVGYHIVIRP